MTSENSRKPIARGRPPKFQEERRPVTVTLPERILRSLDDIGRDRAHAIVKCVEAVTMAGKRSVKSIELINVLPGKSLIVVGPCRSLKKISWLRLVEISPARSLLVLPLGKTIEAFELALLDLVDELDPKDYDEREMLRALVRILSHQRRGDSVAKGEIVFVNTPR